MVHWFSNPKYSVGLGLKLAHILSSDDKFINITVSSFVNDAPVGVLDGDVLRVFLHSKGK